ncbi:hypothetical protein B0H34DRAFT_836952 [Crassisporium funariophilum]|nr:hypothetical protein B0H34DRAFT_836952 [Crassisporium funariophilum]
MVNGPPTPPPTTAAELQDEARGSSFTVEMSTSAPPPNQTNRTEHHQHVLDAMVEAMAKNDIQQVVRLGEETDYNSDDRQPSRLLIIAPLVLGHLILDSLPAARYDLLRLPDNLASLSLSRALTALVTSTTNREHAKVYIQASSLLSLVSQQDFLDKVLASIIESLVTAFLDAFRLRTFELLSKAYTSLPLSLACVYLGLPAEQIILAEKHAWVYDPSTQVLFPMAKPKTFPSRLPPSNISSLASFHLVADSVARLEL